MYQTIKKVQLEDGCTDWSVFEVNSEFNGPQCLTLSITNEMTNRICFSCLVIKVFLNRIFACIACKKFTLNSERILYLHHLMRTLLTRNIFRAQGRTPVSFIISLRRNPNDLSLSITKFLLQADTWERCLSIMNESVTYRLKGFSIR